MKPRKIFRLALFIFIPLAIGFSGSLFTSPSIPTWYASLNKPGFSPPNWLFAPVWTILYLLMGASSFIVYETGFQKKSVKKALTFYVAQLAFNLAWSIIFFGLHLPTLALLEIISLWILILVTILNFYNLSKNAAYLLIPYIAWVTFATILNYAIVRLN